jgi:16S rRNA (adenine1518-N6/adenine1519-N6)-dimethyltransferase
MRSYLSTPRATRTVLERHGLATKKRLGQHFLVSDAVIGKILDRAGVQAGETVLEVGPGIGTLTVALLGVGADVVAVERDEDLPSVLAETTMPSEILKQQGDSPADAASCGSFALIVADALTLDAGTLAAACRASNIATQPAKLVANLPYAVAATLVLDYLMRFEFLEQATVMVQSEVADRMMARPGSKDYGSYTVKLRLYAEATDSFKVAPGNFFPPPRVDSTVITLKRVTRCDVDGTPLTPARLRAAALMADAAFAQRRKTIRNSMVGYLAGSADAAVAAAGGAAPLVDRLLQQTGIAPTLRGERLEVDAFLALGAAFAQITGR